MPINRRSLRIATVAIAVFLLAVMVTHAEAGYLAISLDQLEKVTREANKNTLAEELGGINRLLGLVQDPSGDVILIGRHDPGVPPLTRDHLVAALRAMEPPRVSLEGMPDTFRTGRLAVQFDGGVAQTQFGNDLLMADVALKRLALGLISARLWGVPSYLAMSAEAGATSRSQVRFWFRTKDKERLIKRDGVFYIRRLDVAVKTENIGEGPIDPQANEFANKLESVIEDIAAQNPDIARVKPLLDIVALATALRTARSTEALGFWLKEYRLPVVHTPETFSLLSNRQPVADGPEIEVRGGIDTQVLLTSIGNGDSSAMRQAVTQSRPSRDSLVWPVPLSSWPVQGAPRSPNDDDQRRAEAELSRHPGTSVSRWVVQRGEATNSGPAPQFIFSSRQTATAKQGFQTFQQPAPSPRGSLPSIGGVYFNTVAKPSAGAARLGSSGGGFSLLVNGEDATLPADRFARFATALWAVYLSKTPPGISIDPIGWGLPKHLVRYIGNVMNSDLGRVMREADYLMKQLAVGSERVDVEGFENLDSLSGLHGLTYAGASRRFWFVPEDLQFRAADGVLRFASGHMTLKTAYIMPGNKSIPAEPADIAFKDFFTANYSAIAAKLPIYDDLLDYAKLVGLAMHLKQQGVPLMWFILANRDFLMTEDSPGAVDAIVRQSKVFEGVRIEGGVDLAPTGRYLPDADVMATIRKAAEQAGASPSMVAGDGRALVSSSASFAVGAEHYSVLNQASPAAGRDGAGRRYQTDLALRRDDGEPGLELVRYLDPARRGHVAMFGDGWDLLLPYRVILSSSGFIPFRNVMIKERMIVKDLVTGKAEMLSFSENRYAIAGWVPADPRTSRLIGLFPLTDGSFRLADKIGAEYAFDAAGNITKMFLSPEYQVEFHWSHRLEAADFERVPYHVEPEGYDVQEWRNALLPARLRLIGAAGTEDFTLRTDEDILLYRPVGKAPSGRMLAVMSNGGLRLADGFGNEAVFDSAGHFTALLTGQSVVSGMRQSGQKIDFRYGIGQQGRPVIVEASSPVDPGQVISYRYGTEGELLIAETTRRYRTAP